MNIYKCFHLQMMMALILIGATAQLGFAAERGKAPRRELPDNRKLGTIFNNDTDNILHAMDPQKPVKAIIADYRRAVNEILKAKPGVLAQEVGAPDPVNYRSDVATPTCKYVCDATHGKVLKRLLDAGTDPFTITIEQCRKYGVAVVASYRMNAEDLYRNKRQLEVSDFSRENKHLAIAGACCLDPAHPKVYKHRMEIFREMAEKYDIDGIEFNFQRWYHMISEPEKNYPILTKMVAETRQMLDEVAKKKGRKRLLLGVRVSPSLDTSPSKEAFPGLSVIKQIEANGSCRARGTDVKTWIEKGYVDYICPSLFWPRWPGLPHTDEFVELAKGRDVGIYPTLFPLPAWLARNKAIIKPGDTEKLQKYKKGFCEHALKLYADGADGISTYNWYFHLHLAKSPKQWQAYYGYGMGGSAVQKHVLSIMGDPEAIRKYQKQVWFWPPEELYNGIRLPSPWPPVVRHLSRDPMPVPYLQSPPKVIPIDVGRQLFVDDFLIEKTTLERTFHKAKLHPANPILKPDKPWESEVMRNYDPPSAMPFSGGVWYDSQDRLFKMWYEAGFAHALCYAVSSDGIHWKKPKLDVVPETNIVFKDKFVGSTTVWMDLKETDTGRRFKMMYKSASGEHSIHFSADGIHWSTKAAGGGYAGDRSTFFYNPFRKVWVLSLRASKYWDETESCDPLVKHYGQKRMGHVHSVGRFRRYREGYNLLSAATSWPKKEQPETFRHWRFPTMWVWSDNLDIPRPETGFGRSDPGSMAEGVPPELYNLDAVAYESVMLGLFSIWRGVPKEYPACDKINDICLGFSRDGFHWNRPFREPIIGVSEDPNDWNHSNVQSAGGGCLVVGDKLYFYVSGRMVRDKNVRDGFCSTGLAVMRRDGFASMDAGNTEGVLITRPLRFNGKQLFVNADTKQGQLRVEILDDRQKVIKPFTHENCTALSADKTLAHIRWKGAEDLSAIAGKPVRFRFILKQGQLYSFWVSPDSSGASHGYIAAGGPGFTSHIDTKGLAAY